MCVAGDHPRDLYAHVAGERQDLFRFVARVDDARFAAPTRADYPAVLLKQPDHNAADLELDNLAGHALTRVARDAVSPR